jgi:hypothetical protein
MIIEFHGWFGGIVDDCSLLKKGMGLLGGPLGLTIFKKLDERKDEGIKIINNLLKEVDYAEQTEINFCLDMVVGVNGCRRPPYLLVYYTDKDFGQIVDLVNRLKSLKLEVKKIRMD